MSLLDYERRLAELRMNRRGGNTSPHKVALLLAVLDLIEQGVITRNVIYFDAALQSAFSVRFDEIKGANDRNHPHLPFFHLRSEGFWHHHLRPGKSLSYQQLKTASTPNVIKEQIEYAYVDDELFELWQNQVARRFLASALHSNLSLEERLPTLKTGKEWTWIECEAIVQDYFLMLEQELRGRTYSKTAHRRALQEKLNNRSAGSIEFKHQNISAVLIDMGQPYIQGYKPASNYQQLLKQVVLAHIAARPDEFVRLLKAGDAEAIPSATPVDWSAVLDIEPPSRIPTIREPEREYIARQINYSARESQNRKLGELGEAFALQYEQYRLTHLGRSDLAAEVGWDSKERGDGLGYDIRSFDAATETELFIEVKTTNSGKYQPFFISDNEVAYSREKAGQYNLYRVYNFKQSSRIFVLAGSIDKHVHLSAQTYKASFS